MSARKSFDIGPEKPAAKKTKVPAKTAKKKAVAQPRPKRLRERREEEKGRMRTVVFILCLFVVGLALFGLWRPEVRISTVEASGMRDEEGVEALVQETLSGTTHFVIPNDSFFFYPEQQIRMKVMEAYPRIKSLSVVRNGFTGLSLSSVDRETAFLWCGLPEEVGGECYEADTHGFIFMSAQEFGTTSTHLLVRGYLEAGTSTEMYPLRSRVIGFEHLPKILTFTQSLEAFGTPIDVASIRADEVDLYARSGTRITYVLGHEAQALKDARAALPALNLMDGSVEYIDLRFDGKVYLKRVE